MKKRSLIFNFILLGLLMGNPEIIEAQSAESFQTKEYDAIGDNVLNLINASKAYEQGYTGKNVTIGVCDSPTNFAHPDFAKKQKSGMVNIVGDGNYNWEVMNHGTIVSGIIAADKDDEGMHGVAFDAEIKSVAVGKKYTSSGVWSKPRRDIYKYYIDNPDIKIINNSWGSELYLTDVYHEVKYNIVDEKLKKDNAYKASVEAISKDKLLIFSSGNSGQTTPCIENVMGIFNPKMRNNILSVSASNSSSIFRNADDSLDIDSSSMAIFSNLAKFNEDNTISAPGVDISTTNANFAKDGMEYVEESGTSMAAPVVTGVGALVQQAFPYLGGKQIGDVLLSTANNKLINKEGFFFTWQIEEDKSKESFPYTLNFYFLNDDAGKEASRKTNEELFKQYYSANDLGILYRLDLVGKGSAIDWLENMENAGCIKRYEDVPLDLIFGQGIVDAEKAVQGLGAINVRRMSKDDVSDEYTVIGKKENQALYTVDTKGYDSVWSNDIKEIRAGNIDNFPLGYEHIDFDGKDADIKDLHERWNFYASNWRANPIELYISKRYIDQYNDTLKKEGLLGLHAGLVKTGKGRLCLSGNNQYKGSTIVKDGVLEIEGSVLGDVYTEGKGTLMGTGVIGNNVYNNGTMLGGTIERIGTLTVKGDLSGSGKIIVNSDGYNISKIVVEENVDISKMKIIFKGALRPDWDNSIFIESKKAINPEEKDAIRRTMKSLSRRVLDSQPVDDMVKWDYDSSGLMNIKVVADGQKVRLSTEMENKTGVHEDTFKAVESLYKTSDDAKKAIMSNLFSLDKTNAKIALKQISDGMSLDMGYEVMSHNDVKEAVHNQEQLERLDGIWAMNTKYWQENNGVKSNGTGIAVGKDFVNDEKKRIGAVVTYSKNKITNASNSGNYSNYQVGIYGEVKVAADKVTSYISYGKQDNKYNRYLSAIDENINADYQSNTWGLGVKYTHSLDVEANSKWQKNLYGKLDYNRYKQDAYKEQGDSLYRQNHQVVNSDYLTGELGIECKKEVAGNLLFLDLGYKHVLKGSDLSENISLCSDVNGAKFKIENVERVKGCVVLGAGLEHELSDKWSVAGMLNQEIAKEYKNLRANVAFNYQF